MVAADEHLAARSFRQTKDTFALLGVTSSMAPLQAAAPREDHQRAFDAEVTFGGYLQTACQYLGNHLVQDHRELVMWAPELAIQRN